MLFLHASILLFSTLAHNLVGDLVAPLVDHGHRQIIQEQGHLLATGRTEILPGLTLHLGLDGLL